MSKLPVGGFRWLTDQELSAIDLENLETEGSFGMILEADLIYDKSLHADSRHEQLPCCPIKQDITWEMLSKSQQQSWLKLGKKETSYKSQKLVACFGDKDRFVKMLYNPPP